MSRNLVVLCKDAGDSPDHHKRISTWLFTSLFDFSSVFRLFAVLVGGFSVIYFSLHCQIESVVLFRYSSSAVSQKYTRNILENLLLDFIK